MRHSIQIVVVCLTIVGVTTPVAGHPPATTDHGIPDSAFSKLWSGDTDSDTVTATKNRSAKTTLRHGSDLPLDAPPKAAETWNRRDIEEMPSTDSSTAIHPVGATRTDGTYLKDAGIGIAGVAPSTRVLLSTSRQPLFIAPNGTVYGTVDYRVAVPDGTDSGTRRVDWELVSHEVQSVALRMDGAQVNETTTNNTVRLSYHDRPKNTTGSQQLTLRATVTVQLAETIATEKRSCRDINGSETCRDDWVTRTETHTETVTVEQHRQVSVYQPVLSGYRTTYPDGDTGVVVYRSQPWYGLELPAGNIRGSWRFYVARDQQWDRVVTTNETTSTTRHSPVHPVQVYAYPIETGTTYDAPREITVLDSYGRTLQAPRLPDTVTLDSVSDSYVGSYGIAARASQTDGETQAVRATGLVRGSRVRLQPETTARLPVNRSSLTLAVQNTTADTVTVQVTLRDGATGAPIATAGRDGYITVQDQRLNTTANGTATTAVTGHSAAVTAAYTPGAWWRNSPGYVGDSATVYTGGTVIHYVQLLFRIGVQIGTLLIAGFLIDRITGWGLWPPWRGV